MFNWSKLIAPLLQFLGATAAIVAGILYIESKGKDKAKLEAAEADIEANDEAQEAKNDAVEEVAKTSPSDFDNKYKRFMRNGDKEV